MEFHITTVTDIGIKKKVNQDCVFAVELDTPMGAMAFGVLCDGMGGLQYGEVASAGIINAFSHWAYNQLPVLAQGDIEDSVIRNQWTQLVAEQNQAIRLFGQRNECRVGSTAVALLLTQKRYYLLNVGDSRAYELRDTLRQMTVDHTLVEREVQRGNLTPSQAEHAPIRNILTRCVGVNEVVYPDFFFGTPQSGTIYMLCSDGFRHRVRPEEIQPALREGINNLAQMEHQISGLIELNKQRGETDNISVVSIAAV